MRWSFLIYVGVLLAIFALSALSAYRKDKQRKRNGWYSTCRPGKRIHAVSKALGMNFSDAIVVALGEDVAEGDLTFAQCRKVNDYLSVEQERQKNGDPIDARVVES